MPFADFCDFGLLDDAPPPAEWEGEESETGSEVEAEPVEYPWFLTTPFIVALGLLPIALVYVYYRRAPAQPLGVVLPLA